MKVAVTSQGKDLTSEVDPRFGRAVCFLVVDTKTGEHRVVDNTQNLNATQGAGVQAAQTVANLHVAAVLTGHCGPKAFQVLQSGGIEVYLGAEGTVQEALDRLEQNGFKAAASHDMEGHW